LTVAAASRDTRFRPVQLDELPGIRIEITLLGALTRLPSDAAQWLDRLEPPRHGIHIRKGRNTGLYLPQVARRLGWSPVELLREVSVKAGLAENGWQDPAAEVFAFTARSFAVPLEGLLGDTP